MITRFREETGKASINEVGSSSWVLYSWEQPKSFHKDVKKCAWKSKCKRKIVQLDLLSREIPAIISVSSIFRCCGWFFFFFFNFLGGWNTVLCQTNPNLLQGKWPGKPLGLVPVPQLLLILWHWFTGLSEKANEHGHTAVSNTGLMRLPWTVNRKAVLLSKGNEQRLLWVSSGTHRLHLQIGDFQLATQGTEEADVQWSDCNCRV